MLKNLMRGSPPSAARSITLSAFGPCSWYLKVRLRPAFATLRSSRVTVTS
jgi:hypothetical protein